MDVNEAVQIIKRATRLVFFTGAGLSEESGIPTFRGNDGYWAEFGSNFST